MAVLDLISALVGEGESEWDFFVADTGDGDTSELEALDSMHGAEPNASGRRSGLRQSADAEASSFQTLGNGIKIVFGARSNGDVVFVHAIVNPPFHLLGKGVELGASALRAVQCRLGAVHKGVVAGEVMGVFAFVQVVVGVGAE